MNVMKVLSQFIFQITPFIQTFSFNRLIIYPQPLIRYPFSKFTNQKYQILMILLSVIKDTTFFFVPEDLNR